eukprot:824559-Pleurochrysis_carterae.AAC.1
MGWAAETASSPGLWLRLIAAALVGLAALVVVAVVVAMVVEAGVGMDMADNAAVPFALAVLIVAAGFVSMSDLITGLASMRASTPRL